MQTHGLCREEPSHQVAKEDLDAAYTFQQTLLVRGMFLQVPSDCELVYGRYRLVETIELTDRIEISYARH